MKAGMVRKLKYSLTDHPPGRTIVALHLMRKASKLSNNKYQGFRVSKAATEADADQTIHVTG
jgi:hypothetical protein